MFTILIIVYNPCTNIRNHGLGPNHSNRNGLFARVGDFFSDPEALYKVTGSSPLRDSSRAPRLDKWMGPLNIFQG